MRSYIASRIDSINPIDLKVAPERCLIFEDSRAGVRAGTATGAAVIALGPERGHTPWIADYQALPANFFAPGTEGSDG